MYCFYTNTNLVWAFGDPHVRTLDGVEYTFNGLGEYTLIRIEDDAGQREFELQGRTQRATNSETGELTDATFYSGFAAEYGGSARVCTFVFLHSLLEKSF